MRIIWKSLFLTVLVLSCFGNLVYGQSPFKVGIIMPLTGPAGEYGVAIKNCIELARSDRPELFKNIEFHYEDVAFAPKDAVSAFMKLSQVDEVNLVYTWSVPFCKALAPLAQSRGVPLMGQCIDRDSAAGRKYVMHFMNYTDQYVLSLTKYLKAKNLNKLGILVAEHSYIEEMLQALQRNLQPGQSITIIDRVPTTEMNLRSYITKAAHEDFDAIGVFVFIGQIAEFYKQAAEQKLEKPTFGTNIFENFSEFRNSSGKMEGAVFSSNHIYQPFVDRYRLRYKNESQLTFGGPAYEFALLVGKLFSARGSMITPDEIISAFATAPKETGVAAGPYHYVNDPKVGQFFEFPVVMKRVTKEGFAEIKD